MTDTDTLFLCRYCAQGYEEKNKVPFHECDACAHCGALATNHPSWIGLRGHVIARLSNTGKDEYSALKNVPSFRHTISLSSCTGRPVSTVCTSGHADSG